MTDATPQRGDVVLVDLEPVQGSEADKARPAVVVGNDASWQQIAREQAQALWKRI